MSNKHVRICLLIGSILFSQFLYAQTVYNLVVGGSSNHMITSTNGYDNDLCGADPESFSAGCGDKSHTWQNYRNKAYLTTTLPSSFYTATNFPNGRPQKITILAANVTPGQYVVADNSYVDVYQGTRNKNCSGLCSCNYSQNCTFLGNVLDKITSSYTINIEAVPVFKNIYNFNESISQYTVCTGDPSLLLSTLVDKTGISFYNQSGTIAVAALFDPSLVSAKKQADTVIHFTMKKIYDNGTISKNFSIKVVKSTEITTSGNLSEFIACKNNTSINVADLIKANPLGGSYYLNGSLTTALKPNDFSTPRVNIVYNVTVGVCKSQKIVSVVSKDAPTIKNITSIGTFCNNLKDVPLKYSSAFPYFSDNYDLTVGKKQGVVRGSGIKSAPFGTAASGVSPSFVPNVYDTLQLSKLPEGVHALYYDLKDLTTGCIAIDTFNVTIKAPANIAVSKSIQICNESSVYTLSKDVQPKGGVFKPVSSAYMANDSTLNIGIIPLGKQTIKYTYTTVFGCISSADVMVEIINKPNITMPLDTSFCENSPAKKMIALPAGGKWTGSGITTDGTFTPANLLADETYRLTYSIGIGSCSDAQYMLATIVKRPPSPEIVNAKTEYCTGDSIVVNATVANSSGLKYNWYKNDETKALLINKPDLGLIADKNLKRIFAESVNAQGCVSLNRTAKQFIFNDVQITVSVEEDTIKKGEFTSFKSSVVGDVIQDVIWSFGDGTTGNGPELVHYYYDTGNVIVKAKVMTAKGCAITKYANTVFVIGKPHQISTDATIHVGSMSDDSKNYLEIYPNPSDDGKFNLYLFLTEGKGQIIVQDLIGKIVFTKQVNQLDDMEIDLSSNDIQSGMYMLSLVGSKEKNRVYKIVKK